VSASGPGFPAGPNPTGPAAWAGVIGMTNMPEASWPGRHRSPTPRWPMVTDFVSGARAEPCNPTLANLMMKTPTALMVGSVPALGRQPPATPTTHQNALVIQPDAMAPDVRSARLSCALTLTHRPTGHPCTTPALVEKKHGFR
jgi:hypothetical protein